jgi:hypothetical protein
MVESSLDGETLTEIYRKTDNEACTADWGTATFAVSNAVEFRFIRLTQTGQTHCGDDYRTFTPSSSSRLSSNDDCELAAGLRSQKALLFSNQKHPANFIKLTTFPSLPIQRFCVFPLGPSDRHHSEIRFDTCILLIGGENQ